MRWARAPNDFLKRYIHARRDLKRVVTLHRCGQVHYDVDRAVAEGGTNGRDVSEVGEEVVLTLHTWRPRQRQRAVPVRAQRLDDETAEPAHSAGDQHGRSWR